jgi:NAD(P)-dependent dehydrogenase (short-subunit alcohol dehydrogenase family)
MVSLNIVKFANAALVKSQPLVAVVTGGTSGIGESTLHALATAHGEDGKGLRVYIVGQNKLAAKATISACLKVCPKGDFRFLRAEDLSLLEDVDRVCAEITKAEEVETEASQKPRVDFMHILHSKDEKAMPNLSFFSSYTHYVTVHF